MKDEAQDGWKIMESDIQDPNGTKSNQWAVGRMWYGNEKSSGRSEKRKNKKLNGGGVKDSDQPRYKR